MHAKRLIVAAAVVALVAGGSYVLWKRFGERDEAGEHLTLYGNVDIRQVDLGFRVRGRIAAMKVEEGDGIAADELLARLDAVPYRHDLSAAKGELAARRAELDKMQAGYRPEEIAQAEAQVAERKAALANAKRVLQRREALLRSNNVSRQAYDDAVAANNEAEARLTSSEKALELLRAGYRQEDIAAAQANVDAAKAKVALAATNLGDTALHAPADGIVLTRVQEEGAVVAAGEPVYVLSLTRPVWVRAYVSEPDLGRLKPGMAAEVRTDSEPDRVYSAHVGFISPRAEFTPKSVETPELRTSLVYRLRLVVDDREGRLRQGMPVTVTLPATSASGDTGDSGREAGG